MVIEAVTKLLGQVTSPRVLIRLHYTISAHEDPWTEEAVEEFAEELMPRLAQVRFACLFVFSIAVTAFHIRCAALMFPCERRRTPFTRSDKCAQLRWPRWRCSERRWRRKISRRSCLYVSHDRRRALWPP